MIYTMHCIIAFICRTALLVVYVVLGQYENQAVELDMLERAVVTCMQVCLLGAAWAVYEVCAFVVRTLSQHHVYESVQMLPLADDARNPVCDDHDAENPPADNERPRRAAEPTAVPVVFASRFALAQYVFQVHIIGLVVWTTMLSIDYTLTQTSFAFILGMLLGNVAAVVSGRTSHKGIAIPVICVYWGLICALVLLYLVQDGASAFSNTESELGIAPNRIGWSELFTVLNVLLSPASCGFSWTFWMDARTLLAHYHTSLYTSVLFSVPVLVFVQGDFVAHILQRYSPLWLAHVIVTEPVLKFMTIYVMTLSLEPENVIEMLVVNTTVIGVCYLCFAPHEHSFVVTVAILVTCLFVLHAARLAKRALNEFRTHARETFVIVDE